MKKRILACLCALVCLCSNATRSDALFGALVDNVIGVVGEAVVGACVEVFLVSGAKDAINKKNFSDKYIYTSVLWFAFLLWDCTQRTIHAHHLNDLQKKLGNTDENKTDGKNANSKDSKK